MRFSISIPQLDSGGFDPAGLKRYLTRAEELGFEGGWTVEQTVGPAPLIAPLELLAYAAACTTRLRLGVAVLITSLHDPLQLAATVTAVDRLSGGRLDVGIAPGGGTRQFPAFGVAQSTFVGYFTEGLELMKAAWSDEPTIDWHGRFRDVDGLTITPKPIQRPHPPIWFGGHAPAALARAVRLGDAFIGAGSGTIEDFASEVVVLRRELDEQQRDASTFTIAKRMYLMVDDDAARAKERVLAGLGVMYGPRPQNEDIAIWGTSAQAADAIRRAGGRGRGPRGAESVGPQRRRGPRADGAPGGRGHPATRLTTHHRPEKRKAPVTPRRARALAFDGFTARWPNRLPRRSSREPNR